MQRNQKQRFTAERMKVFFKSSRNNFATGWHASARRAHFLAIRPFYQRGGYFQSFHQGPE
jgi:hypothetical protein